MHSVHNPAAVPTLRAPLFMGSGTQPQPTPHTTTPPPPQPPSPTTSHRTNHPTTPTTTPPPQGVHQVFEGVPDRKWLPGEPRTCKMVFIGKYLLPEDFREAFESCLVKKEDKQPAPVA